MKPYSLSISSRTRLFLVSSRTDPVSVFLLFLPVLIPYPFLISSSTGNGSQFNTPFRTHFLFLPVRETIFPLNIFPYPSFSISSRTGTRTHFLFIPVRKTVANVIYLPVSVFYSFQYSKPYSLNIFLSSLFSSRTQMHSPFFISSSTGYGSRCNIYVRTHFFFQCEKPYSLSISSRTRRFYFLTVR